MSTLRQGNLSLLQNYDEVKKKITLLTNKTIMNYDTTVAASLNEKYRADALRVFISGVRKSLSDVIFSAKPADLPSALALAQEVESNHERYNFSSNFARSMEERAQKFEQEQPSRDRTVTSDRIVQQGKNPYFSRRQGPPRQDQVHPMDVDNSSRFRQPTQYQQGQSQRQTPNPNTSWQQEQNNQTNSYNSFGQTNKRPNSGTARFTGPKQQRITHLAPEKDFTNQEDSLPD